MIKKRNSKLLKPNQKNKTVKMTTHTMFLKTTRSLANLRMKSRKSRRMMYQRTTTRKRRVLKMKTTRARSSQRFW